MTDFSQPTRPVVITWRRSLIQSASCPRVGRIEISEEDRQILDIMRDALRYAEEEEGLVPTEHIAKIYDLVVKHIKGQGIPETITRVGNANRTKEGENISATFTREPRKFSTKTRHSCQTCERRRQLGRRGHR